MKEQKTDTLSCSSSWAFLPSVLVSILVSVSGTWLTFTGANEQVSFREVHWNRRKAQLTPPKNRPSVRLGPTALNYASARGRTKTQFIEKYYFSIKHPNHHQNAGGKTGPTQFRQAPETKQKQDFHNKLYSCLYNEAFSWGNEVIVQLLHGRIQVQVANLSLSSLLRACWGFTYIHAFSDFFLCLIIALLEKNDLYFSSIYPSTAGLHKLLQCQFTPPWSS